MENRESWDFLVWMVLLGGVALFVAYLVLGAVAYYLDKKETKPSNQ